MWAGFIAHGVASSFEGNVPWELRDADGTVVRSGHVTAGMETTSSPGRPSRSTCPISTAGQYIFVATTDDGSSPTRGPSSSCRSATPTDPT